MMNDWNPDQYLRFKKERTQPSIDLVSRITLDEPQWIIDIGCGPGNSTQILAHRWPKSHIVGLDSSAAMIEKATHDYPGQYWLLGDAMSLDPTARYDLVFSNATFQWIPRHETLLPTLFHAVNPNGVFAAQIPMFHKMPIYEAIETVTQSASWKNDMEGCNELFTYHDPNYYYDIVSALTPRLELWETRYMHILGSQGAVIDFLRTTGLKPYLERLSSTERKLEFEQDVLAACNKDYPVQANGTVLFPFERFFFIAYKQ